MGFLFGANKAAKKIAKAQVESAQLAAQNDRLNAQSAEAARETMIAQDQASRAAAITLQTPQDTPDVNLSPSANTPVETDPLTGARRTARQTFMAATPTSGIKL